MNLSAVYSIPCINQVDDIETAKRLVIYVEERRRHSCLFQSTESSQRNLLLEARDCQLCRNGLQRAISDLNIHLQRTQVKDGLVQSSLSSLSPQKWISRIFDSRFWGEKSETKHKTN